MARPLLKSNDYFYKSREFRDELQVPTEEARYSISRWKSCLALIETLKQKYKIDPSKFTIVDGTSCVGSDLITFNFHFRKVIGIELNPIHFEALSHNISVYHAHFRDEFPLPVILNADTLKFLSDFVPTEPTILYLDLPWGGKNYKSNKHLELYMSSIPLGTIISRITAKQFTFVVAKVPKNYATPDLPRGYQVARYTDKKYDYIIVTPP